MFSKCMLYLLSFSVFFLENEAVFYEKPGKDFATCQSYKCSSGSSYTDYFKVHEDSANNIAADLHFSVQAAKEARILLASSQASFANNEFYEIVLGAKDNKFTYIRRKKDTYDKKEFYAMSDVISDQHFRNFWIHFTKDGVIEVGREGHKSPLAMFTDTAPLTVAVFSFSSDVDAEWLYDCSEGDDGEDPVKDEDKQKKLEEEIEMLRNQLQEVRDQKKLLADQVQQQRDQIKEQQTKHQEQTQLLRDQIEKQKDQIQGIGDLQQQLQNVKKQKQLLKDQIQLYRDQIQKQRQHHQKQVQQLEQQLEKQREQIKKLENQPRRNAANTEISKKNSIILFMIVLFCIT